MSKLKELFLPYAKALGAFDLGKDSFEFIDGLWECGRLKYSDDELISLLASKPSEYWLDTFFYNGNWARTRKWGLPWFKASGSFAALDSEGDDFDISYKEGIWQQDFPIHLDLDNGPPTREPPEIIGDDDALMEWLKEYDICSIINERENDNN